MDKKFKLDKSLYVMMLFIGGIGCMLLFIRSDFILQNKYFVGQQEKTIQLASEDDFQTFEVPTFLIITGDDNRQFSAQIIERLEKMGKKAVSIPVDEFVGIDGDFEGIVTATENLDAIQDRDNLLQYVKNGGGLFFAVRPSPGAFLSALYQQFGMTEVGSFIETTGLEFVEPAFKTEKSRVFNSTNLVNSSLRVRLSPSSELQISSGEGVPLLWKKEYGEGRFIFFNGTILSQPAGTGLLARGLQLLTPEFIYPVVNAAPTVLRGFPFPISEGRYNERMTNEYFFRNVFWPEMLRIEAKRDLNYTSAFVSDPGEFQAKKLSSSQENLILYGRELLRLGGEMAVGGYSEQLVEESGFENLGNVYQGVLQRMEHALPGYKVHSYIPTVISGLTEQIEALNQSFKGITAMMVPKEGQTALLESTNRPMVKIAKGDESVSSKTDEPKIDGEGESGGTTVFLPETFIGFRPDAFSEWLIVNSILADGYFAQVIEPQIFLQEDTGEETLVHFDEFTKQIAQEVPWLQRTRFSEAGENALHTNRQVVYSKKTKNGVTFQLNKVSSPSYFFFYTDKKIKSLKDCKVVKIGYQLYLIESSKLSFSIGLEG